MSSNKEIYNKILEGVDDNIVFTSLLSYLPVNPRKYNTASYGPGLRPEETPEDRLLPNKEQKIAVVENAGCVVASGHADFPYGSPSGSIPDYWFEKNPTNFGTENNPSGITENPDDRARRLAWEAAGRPSTDSWFRPTVEDVLEYKRGVCGVGAGWPPTDDVIEVFPTWPVPNPPSGTHGMPPRLPNHPNWPLSPSGTPPTNPPDPERPRPVPTPPQLPTPPPTRPTPPPPDSPSPTPPNKPPPPPAPQDPPDGTFDPPASPGRPQDPDQPTPPSVVYPVASTPIPLPDPITDPLTLSGGFYSSIRRIDIHASKKSPNMVHGWIAPGDYRIESNKAPTAIYDDGANLRAARCINGFNAHNEVNYSRVVDNPYLGGNSINRYFMPNIGNIIFPSREEGSGGDVVGSPLRDGNLSNGYKVQGMGTSINQLHVNYIPLSFTQRRSYRLVDFSQYVMINIFGYSNRRLLQYNGLPQKSLKQVRVRCTGTLFYYVLPKIGASKRIKVASYEENLYRNKEIIAYTSSDKRIDMPEIRTVEFGFWRTIKVRSSLPPDSLNEPLGAPMQVLQFNRQHILPIAINNYTTYAVPEWYS
jgi:hypothetical protein